MQPVEETMTKVEEAMRQGLKGYIGVIKLDNKGKLEVRKVVSETLRSLFPKLPYDGFDEDFELGFHLSEVFFEPYPRLRDELIQLFYERIPKKWIKLDLTWKE